MILGKIFGKCTTNEFSFLVENKVSKFEYVQVYSDEYDYVLCQVIELTKEENRTVADCIIIGYNEGEKIKKPMIPFEFGSEVLLADNNFIRKVISLSSEGAFIGKLSGKDVDVHLDLNKVLTMHMAVLAKSGSGKSYAVGVLLEEMLLKNIPLVIIDPHGEYSSLKFANENVEDLEKLTLFGLEKQGFNVVEYGHSDHSSGLRPLKLSKKMSRDELLHLIPGKLSNSQLAALYSALKELGDWSFESLLLTLDMQDSPAKFSVMSLIDNIMHMNIFSDLSVSYNDLVQPGKASILNLKGYDTEIQEIVVFKICKDLFELRKRGKIPPFFLVVEEAHNFCPERSFGETKASKIIRNIASEGRKFGLGLCAVSQRPARVDKSVLSQCSTQFILKVTNPNDLKALINSVEGINSATEKEIQNLPIGSAVVTGLTDVPLFVDIRPRLSMHGGRAQKVMTSEEISFIDKVKEFDSKKVFPVIKPQITLKDLALMSDNSLEDYAIVLVPCVQLICKDSTGEFRLLLDLVKGGVVVDKNEYIVKFIPDLNGLSKLQLLILKNCLSKKNFSKEDVASFVGGIIDFDSEFNELIEKDLVLKTNDVFSLNEKFVFSKLSKVCNFDSIKHEEVGFDVLLDAMVSLDDLLSVVSRFVRIVDRSSCYLLTYKLK
ncbi:ATP-binding protein [Candidatus Woesearchaeota archaeon]|nr:ATP-binding protein [Candidatus Woesearchaeota archaeon]